MEIGEKVIYIRLHQDYKSIKKDILYTIKTKYYDISNDELYIKLKELPDWLTYRSSEFVSFNKYRKEKILKIKERIHGNR
jgi:trans-2-enoyl-CoA reductase